MFSFFIFTPGISITTHEHFFPIVLRIFYPFYMYGFADKIYLEICIYFIRQLFYLTNTQRQKVNSNNHAVSNKINSKNVRTYVASNVIETSEPQFRNTIIRFSSITVWILDDRMFVDDLWYSTCIVCCSQSSIDPTTNYTPMRSSCTLRDLLSLYYIFLFLLSSITLSLRTTVRIRHP